MQTPAEAKVIDDLQLIEKHARQKKAKLVAHCNGRPVLFADRVIVG